MAGKEYNVARSLILLTILAFLLQGNLAQGSNELPDTMEGIKKKYAHLSGFSMAYTREVITRSMSMLGNQVKGDLATGRIHFNPPYSLRLEQETPQPETVITDGDTLWWYIPHKKRMYQYPSEKFGKELRLLSDIFRGLTKVKERFQVKMVAANERGEHQLELRPEPPWQEIDHIALTVAKGYDIKVVEIHNQLGGITRFTLKGLRVEKEFEEGFFQLIVPEGVELVEEGG